MITLIVIIMLWFCISCYRINKACKRKGLANFEVLEGLTLDSFGFTVGIITASLALIFLFLSYLP